MPNDDIPTPKFVFPAEDSRDWADSRLYQCVIGNQPDDENLNPESRPILSQTECEYQLQLLKKHIGDISTQFELAKVTCEVLVANMVSPDIVHNILEQHYISQTKESLTKLLFRCT